MTAPDKVDDVDNVDSRPLGATGYLAAEGLEAELCAELGIAAVPGQRLYFVDGAPQRVAWAANVWYDPVELRFPSIGAAARALRGLGRNWALLPTALYRRAALIAERLPHVSARPLVFPAPLPTAPLGSWTLSAPDRIVAAPRCASPFVHGEARFVEDKHNPPSRAYLKLWEALTLAQRWPRPGELCLDLGASPGGWTWALHELGATVVSVDKAPLAPTLARKPRLTWRGESAFALDPAREPAYAWVVSDVICYPSRLRRLIERWLASQPQASYVITVKFQGATDMTDVHPLADVPGARLVHLHHNRHELTWIRLAPQTSAPAAASARQRET